jgi:DNA polymerase-3 subunit epsilon
VAPAFRGACGDLPLVFHNAAFDLAFLRPFLRGAGLAPLGNAVIDTLGLARGLFGPGNNSLGALRESLGLPEEARHRALGDALTAARTLLALAPRWERERGTRTLEELAAASQDVLRTGPRRGPACQAIC